MRFYKNKRLVARNSEGLAVAYIGIIDKHTLDIDEMKAQGYAVKETFQRRTPEQIEADKIAAIIRGEIQ